MAEQITEAELVEALMLAMKRPSTAEAPTSDEIRQATGIGEKRLRRALLQLSSESRLEVVKVVRPTIDGRRVEVPGYRILPPMKKSSRLSKRR